MNVIPIVPRGYCKGVIRAIQCAKQTRAEHPHTPIYVLGMIVHNQMLVDALEAWQIHTIDDTERSRRECLDDIPEGIVILTAHGTDDAVKQEAIKRGLQVVDATCTDVYQTKRVIQNYLAKGYDILYLGKRHHPEANAMLSIDPRRIHLIASKDEAASITFASPLALALTTQTTMSYQDCDEWIAILKERFPDLIVEPEICSATRMRQQAVLSCSEADRYIIVGDPHSNNTRQLANLVTTVHQKPVLLIESVQDLQNQTWADTETIAVSAGASTPTYLTRQVIEYLTHYPCDIPAIDPMEILNEI